MAFHGHYMTMKITWAQGYHAIWQKVVCLCHKFGVQILGGDFNMCLPHVPYEFSSRGLKCDCLAWYPWEVGLSNQDTYAQKLGYDSMAFFI